jgi:hypothetical protein
VDALEIDMREFDKLRDEIVSRQSAMTTLTNMELVALGAAVSVSTRLPEALLGAAIVTILLWMSFIAQRQQVLNLGDYIATRLQPRLRTTSEHALEWERFVRSLPSQRGDWWSYVLFVAMPIVLLAIYASVALSQHHLQDRLSLVLMITVVIVILFVLAIRQLRSFHHRSDDLRERLAKP